MATAETHYTLPLPAFDKPVKLLAGFKPKSLGTKRATVGSGFYEAFERPNVALVDVLASPIERATAKGIVMAFM